MSKVIELFCMADDFCKFFDAMMAKYTLKPVMRRPYHRASTMSKAEIMLIMILFHDSGYRCLKHFYLEKVCRHMRHLFPKVVSYNRFVELEKEVAIPLALFIKKVLLGKCTGISFVYNQQNEMYWHFRTKCSFPKTKRTSLILFSVHHIQ